MRRENHKFHLDNIPKRYSTPKFTYLFIEGYLGSQQREYEKKRTILHAKNKTKTKKNK